MSRLRMRIILCLMLFTGQCISVFSQIQFSDYGLRKHGLSIEEPFHSGSFFTQDSLGRLIAHNSVFLQNPMMFDGKKFKPFTYKHQRKLMNNFNAQNWYCTDPFVAIYDDGRIHFEIDVRQYLERNITFLYKYEDHFFLFCNDGYIKFYLTENGYNYIDHRSLATTRIREAYLTSDTIYIKSNHELGFLLQDSDTEVSWYSIPGLKNTNLFLLPNGKLVVNGKRGVSLIDSSVGYYDFLLSLDNSISNLYLDSRGGLWCYIRNDNYYGPYYFHKSQPTPTFIDLGIDNTKDLNFYEDNIEGIWIGSRGQGIFHLYRQSVTTINKNAGFYDDNVVGIYQDPNSDTHFISYNCSGIDVIEKGELSHHFLDKNCQNPILMDSKGRLWISSAEIRVYKDENLQATYTKNDGLHSRIATFVFEDSHKDIWVGTRQVLHKYNGNGFIKFQIPDLDTYDRLFNIVEMEDNRFLLAIDNGSFYWFDGTNFEKLDVEPINSMNLFKDSEGTIWLATDDRGLMIFENDHFKEIAANEKLPRNISFLQESKNGMLFGLSNDNTIFYALKEDLRSTDKNIPVQFITIDNGLPLVDLNTRFQPSSALLNDGSIIFPNIYGGIKINPEELVTPKKSFKQLLYVEDTLLESSTIELPYGKNHLNLSISNAYLNPQVNIENQYALNDGDWITIEDQDNIRLFDIPRGHNQIRFRARHAGGKWLPEKIIFLFTPKLVYERWWFVLLLILLFASSIFLFSHWRNRVIAFRNKELQEKVDEQTEALHREKSQLANSLKVQKELTHELNLSQESKNRMYAQISHEFKSPLQAIKAHLSKGEHYILPEDKNRIRGNIENLLTISNEIMELSKAESGELRIKKNFYNINAIIQDQIDLKLPLAEEKQITIHHPNNSQKVYLEIDISLIQKTISNLLSNAIKFSRKGSDIFIESKTIHKNHCVRIVDQGPGIPREEIQYLTKAYFQASNNTERGTGIGLSLVQEILRLHGSQLIIKSSLGKGSSFGFDIELPNQNQQDIAKMYTDSTDINIQLDKVIDKTKAVILAVDDSLDVLYFIKQSLSGSYNVITASNGKEGLEALYIAKPQLIISDLNMPVMSGFEFLKEVRKDIQFQALPFIFLTGSMSESTEIMSIKSGADHLLQKPVDEDILLLQVTKTLSRKKTIESSSKSKFTHDLLPANIHNDDLTLMKTMEELFLEHLDNPKLKSADIADMMGIGEKTLRNRIKKITQKTIKEYLRNFRLEKAKILIEEGHGTLGEIAIATGFSSLSYFSKSYKAYFGRHASKQE